MKTLHVAVIGAGTAGLAAAILLKRQGHSVKVYEKFNTPQPLGAGLLLQPTGLAILNALGLDQQIIEKGSVIKQLHGKVAGSRWTTLDIPYKRFKDHYFGVGAHRGDLFSALYQKANGEHVQIIVASEINTIERVGDQVILIDKNGQASDRYDLIVDCSGAKSHLRQTYADIKLNKPYPYGALWGIVDIPHDSAFDVNTLDQRYQKAYYMIGLLPMGLNADGSATRAAFFWSLRLTDYPAWCAQDLTVWKQYVGNLWPEIQPLLAQFKTHDDLTLATYNDVILRSYHTDKIVFIGDAAHCTSPQLGQGANLGLVDAYELAASLAESDHLGAALQLYTKRRRSHVRLYQFASRILTPFFQSDSWFFAKIRFCLCGISCRIPFTQKIAARLLSGTMMGPFRSLNPGQWAKAYDLSGSAATDSKSPSY